MYGYDDESLLGEYLAVYSTAGNLPASYRQRQPTRVRSLAGGLSAIVPQPLNVGGVKFVAVQTAALQRFLKAFGAPQTGVMTLPKSGYSFPATDGTQKAYVAWQKFSKETAPIRVAIAEDTGSLAERKADRLQRMKSLVMVHPNVAKRVATAAAAPAPTKAATTSTISVNVAEMQKIMITLGVDKSRIQDGKYGPTTKAKWAALAKSRGLVGTSSGRAGARSASVNRKTWNTLKAAAVSAAPMAATDIVVSTAEIQGLLAALGFTAPGNALTDGRYGPTTSGTWAQAATKRKLDPFMAKKTVDGKQVVVRKATYLNIKADADAKVSPREPMSLKQLDPKLIAVVTPQEMDLLLSKLIPEAGSVVGRYMKAADRRNLDGRIEPSGENWVVLRATLDKLVAVFQAGAPSTPPPGPQRTALERDVETLLKGSTASVGVKTLRRGLNSLIRGGQLPGPIVKTTTPWEPSLRSKVIAVSGAPQAAIPVWERALTPGKLVSQDGKTVRLLPPLAKRFKDLSAKLQAAKKAEAERLKGFTEVNPAEVIARINNLGVSDKKFDRAGGAKELSDAIRTFFDNTGKKAPSGDLVRTDKNDVFVKSDAMLALALAVKEADQRAAATKKFRDGMVAAALSSATSNVPVLTLQKAFKDAVLVQKTSAGPISKKALDLYKRVSLSGAFDKPTRDAFTELARTVTIGPSVQEFQKLLGAQKRFTTEQINKQVVEVRNQVWNAYLDKAVAKKDGKLSVAMPPSLAAAARQGAQRYDQNVAKEAQQQEQVAAQKKVLNDAVKKSTAILSMVAVQQGLKRMAGPAREKINPTGVKISGAADKATRDGLFQLSSMIFPEGYSLPETMWVAYLKQVGKKVVSGGQVTPTWKGANYISLPPALAKLLAKNAGAWIAKHGAAPIQVVDFKNPSVITVVVPKPKPAEVTFTEKEVQERVKERVKEVVSAKEPAADAEADRLAREKAEADRRAREEAERRAREEAAAEAARKAELARRQAEQERLNKEREEAAARAAAQAAREAELRLQAAQEAGRRREAEQAAAEAQRAAAAADARAQAAQEAATREAAARQQASAQETAAQAGGAQVTGPTISITTPQQAGMGGMGGLALGVGALALLLLSQRGDKQPEQE